MRGFYTMVLITLQSMVLGMAKQLESQIPDEEIEGVLAGLTQKQAVCTVFAWGHILGMIIGGAISSLFMTCWMVCTWIIIGVLVYVF